MDSPLEWFASLIAILSTTFRSLNLGHQTESYLVSIASYLIFIYYAEKSSQRFLNGFYILTALIGAWRWRKRV